MRSPRGPLGVRVYRFMLNVAVYRVTILSYVVGTCAVDSRSPISGLLGDR